jgi:hypothetical protein
MNRCDGHHALARFRQRLARAATGDRAALQLQQRMNHLQAVGDPVMHFLHQEIFLPQQGVSCFKVKMPLRDIARDSDQ